VAASGAGPAVAASDGAGLGGAGPAVDVAPAGAMVLAPAVRADDGTREDVAALAARVHADGARLLVDVTLLAGVAPLALPATGADGAVLAADRWLLGPEGTAAAWLAPAPGSDAIAALRALVDPLPRRTALGLARSVGWLLMYAGLPWVLERTAGAARNLADALAAVPGVTVVTRPDRLAAVVAFRVAHWDPAEARRELGRRAFAILGEPAGDAVRAAVGAWTTPSELRRFVAAVAELAAHTPATLPPRPPLIVLSSSPAPGDPSDG
jgi:selenocysteine lyase/cysteine desulfurase